MFEVGWSRSCRDESQELQSEKTWNEEYRKNSIVEIRDNGNTRITEIEVGYLSKPEGTVDMGTKWAIKRDKAAKVSGAKVQKLPYPLDGSSLSKADNAKTEAEANDMAKIPYRAIVGMLSYIMGHTKPDIAYALNVLSRYCNNPGRRHVEFLLCLVKVSCSSGPLRCRDHKTADSSTLPV